MDIGQWTRRLAVVLAVLWVGSVSLQVAAQESTAQIEVGSSAQATAEQLERAVADLEQSTDLAADIKARAIENYRAAIKNLQTAAEFELRLKALITEAESVVVRTQQLKDQRVELKDKKPTLDDSLGIQTLEQLLPTTELQLSGFKRARQEAETDLQARPPRRKEIRARLVVIQEKLSDAATQLSAMAGGELTPLNQSLIARLMTRKITLEKERPALEAELSKFDAEEAADLVRLRMEVASANTAYTEKQVALLQQKINSLRELAAEEAVRVARREAIEADPALKTYAEQNQQLAESAKGIAEALAETTAKMKNSTVVYNDLVRQFAQTKKKVKSVGLSSSVGALLRKQMTTLPNVDTRRAEVAGRQKLINDTHYQLFEHEESQQELADIDVSVERILAEASQEKTIDVSLLKSAATELMDRKREYLDDLVRTTGQYFDTLIELDTVDRQIIALESDYEKYIDERVLWIRSGRPLTTGIQIEASDSWLLLPAKWNELFKVLARDTEQHYLFYLAGGGILVLILVQRHRARQTLVKIGDQAVKANCRSIGPTWHALGLTVILSLGWPLFCVSVGWRLLQVAGESEFTAAVGHGLWDVGWLWGVIELVRQLCCRNGVGESHFRWPVHSTTTFRREVKMCAFIVLPLFFVASTLSTSDGIHERSGLQRIAFILGMTVIAYFVFRLLRPAGILRGYFAENSTSLLTKCRVLLPLGGIALCMSLVFLAVAGYFYTAQTLFWRLLATYLYVGILVVAQAVFYRMLFLRRRQLSIEQARERAAAAASAAATTADDTAARPQLVGGIATENQQADIGAQSLQSRNLVSAAMSVVAIVGLWMIWIQVLPALSMIGDHPVWGKSGVVAASAAAQPAISPMPVPDNAASEDPPAAIAGSESGFSSSVTVADLALAVLIVVVTFVMFRNGPGLLEISVLQQLPLDASVRYAITTLVSYVIVMIGTIAACSTIGLQWSQIQWLATALTFGLAFGLQEMFANFVAGLIILIERPVRVGDVVTVDDVTGVVSRIRIRATSITNWDRKEYVVPNKEFITGKLLNWTLSDKVNRVLIEVGLAYGSDTEHARSLLLEVAQNHPVVLKDPPSVATFEKFGDNSLNLVLRVFLPSLEDRLQIIHELHTAIDQSFRRAKIEIAFPQRDLHIRSVSGAAALGLQTADDENDERGELQDAA